MEFFLVVVFSILLSSYFKVFIRIIFLPNFITTIKHSLRRTLVLRIIQQHCATAIIFLYNLLCLGGTIQGLKKGVKKRLLQLRCNLFIIMKTPNKTGLLLYILLHYA